MVDEKVVLNLVKSTPGGKHQNEIWKELGIDSRKCSRLLSKLLEQNLVTRESVVYNKVRTYLIKAVDEEAPDTNHLLFAGDVFSPCTGCVGNCVPEACPALTIWIMSLHDNPEELDGCYGFTKIPEIFIEEDYETDPGSADYLTSENGFEQNESGEQDIDFSEAI